MISKKTMRRMEEVSQRYKRILKVWDWVGQVIYACMAVTWLLALGLLVFQIVQAARR